MFINWGDEFADGGGGAGSASSDEVAALNKALSAGTGQPVAGQQVAGAMAPLMPESLDAVLASQTYDSEDFPFWKGLFKSPAYNTAEEYNRLHAVGNGEAGFVGEADLPEEDDSTYSREVGLVKFLGTTRRVTHVASLVRTVGVENAIAAETKNGTLWLMRILEESLFRGDSSLVSVQFDGLDKLMADGGTPTYDMRGSHMSEEVINGMLGVTREAPNYGRVDTLHMPIVIKSDVANIVRARLRQQFGAQVDIGLVVDTMTTQHGKVDFKDNIFLQVGQAPHAAGLGQAGKRPLSPVLGAVTTPVNASGLFAAADAGNYYYYIVAGNRYGRSAPVATAVVAVAAGDSVNIPVTDGGQDTSYYIVYRSTLGGALTTAKEAFRVARSGPTQTIIDLNAYLPGTGRVYGVESKPDNVLWKQLAPFTKIPLATVDRSIRWMQVLYGVLQMRKPRHNFKLINVGRDPNAPTITPAFVGF